MLKVKPILIFIIASVTLHWWILSLPIFKRIQVLESNTAKTSSPILTAYLDQAQPVIKPPEKEKTQSQATQENNSEGSNRNIQPPPPPPSFLRGSPWSRRPTDTFNLSPTAPLQQTPLVQIESSIAEDISAGSFSQVECKRNVNSNLFSCQGSSYKALNEKMSDAINRKILETNLALPNCITLEALQKKWHAKACHS